jgi:site-specific recombinase XerD
VLKTPPEPVAEPADVELSAPAPLVLKLPPEDGPELVAVPSELESAADYLRAARSPRTLRAYRTAWLAFQRWCSSRGVSALPVRPQDLALYVAHLADLQKKAATIDLALAAVAKVHQVAGHESPRGAAIVREMRAGVRRTLGTAQRAAAPLLVEDLAAVVDAIDGDELADLRDRALLLLGWDTALRRSNIVALDMEDIGFKRAAGLEVWVRREKRDQEGAGRKVGIPFAENADRCPVIAVRTWLKALEIKEGPVFRSVDRWGHVGGRLSDRDVARILKRRAEDAGIDPEALSGHSLRRGFATSAAGAGKSERAIMRQGGWTSVTMVRRYIEDANVFGDNAAEGLL